MKTIRIPVMGMSCLHCEGRVTKHLLKNPGIKQVKASFKQASVEVTYEESEVTYDTIVSFIEDSGYDVKK